MPDLAAIAAAAAAEGLTPLGAFHPAAEDARAAGHRNARPARARRGRASGSASGASPEFGDGAGDPLDRWSARVVGGLAERLGAVAVFPFGGPPWAPFTAWARRSGEAWESPVGLLVHARLGLFVSYRGALAFRERLDAAAAGAASLRRLCARPACSACPVGALGAGGL